MAASAGPSRRVLRHPAFIALASIFTSLVLCVGIGFGAVRALSFTCEQSGFVYPHWGSEFYRAQVVSIDCGALSDFDARVVLSTPRKNGRGYDEEVVFMSALNPTTITLKWESKDRLIVEYEWSNYARITKSLPKWRNVTITYRVK